MGAGLLVSALLAAGWPWRPPPRRPPPLAAAAPPRPAAAPQGKAARARTQTRPASNLHSSRSQYTGPLPYGLYKVNELAEEGAVPEAHALLREIERDTPRRLQRMLYNTAIKACSRAGEYEVAKEYHKAMLNVGIVPSLRTYGKIMHTAWVARRYEETEQWIEVMEKASLPLDRIHLNMALRAAAERDDGPRVQHWLQRIEELGKEVDTFSMSVLVNYAVRSGNQTMADLWFDRALE